MWPFKKQQPEQPAQPKKERVSLMAAIIKAKTPRVEVTRFKAPELIPGVIPANTKPAIAMDSACASQAYDYLNSFYSTDFQPFPGYPYLAQLATRAEYRSFASTLSTEITREFIEITCKDRGQSKDKADRIKALEEACEYFNLRNIIKNVAENETLFGRGQISININGADRDTPLILDPRTIRKGSLRYFTSIEPMWTSPSAYNAIDPTAPDFYKPHQWWVLGQAVHASRLMTIITRPLPDMLKPAYNFSGMSLSQLAEPYVKNWLRTRTSVSNLLDKFSRTFLKTDMSQVLQGADDGASLYDRVDYYTATYSNMGMGVIDMDREDIIQVNTPLSGLHELQSQSQEHMCAVSRIPAMILTGISPSGLNASSDGEVRAFYDWISAMQEAHYYQPIDTMLKVIQLHLWGEIDDAITFKFKPLWQASAVDESTIRVNRANEANVYVAMGALDAQEVRQNLADDPDSGWDNIDASEVIYQPEDDYEPEVTPEAQDRSVSEAQHKAMLAAAHGSGDLGIPKDVGEEFVKKDAE
jgi:phage-related protein (TIGR01555 family)